MYAVERADEVEAVVVGEWLGSWVGEPSVGEPRIGESLAGAGKCELRDVIADDPGLGKLLRHSEHRATGTTADVGHVCATAKEIDDSDCR